MHHEERQIGMLKNIAGEATQNWLHHRERDGTPHCAAKPFARPSSRYREIAFDVDEQLISASTEAARHLLRAADAPLPNSAGVIDQRATKFEAAICHSRRESERRAADELPRRRPATCLDPRCLGPMPR